MALIKIAGELLMLCTQAFKAFLELCQGHLGLGERGLVIVPMVLELANLLVGGVQPILQ